MKYEIRKFSHKSNLRQFLFSMDISSRTEFNNQEIDLKYNFEQIRTITKIKIDNPSNRNNQNLYQKCSLPILQMVTGKKKFFPPRKNFKYQEKNWKLET